MATTLIHSQLNIESHRAEAQEQFGKHTHTHTNTTQSNYWTADDTEYFFQKVVLKEKDITYKQTQNAFQVWWFALRCLVGWENENICFIKLKPTLQSCDKSDILF